MVLFVLIANSAVISDTLFLPNKPFYFLKEWTRSSESFLTFDGSRRMELRLGFTLEKLNEIRKVSKDNSSLEKALASYLVETENLKLASESLRNANNDKLANKIINELFYQRQVLANSLGVDILDKKNYAMTSSFNNFISSAFYIGSEDGVFNSIKNHINTIDGDELKIKELDYILAYSSSAIFKENILSLQTDIIENKVVEGFGDDSTANFFNSKLAEIKSTDFYKKRTIALEKKKQEKLINEISKGEWVDEIIPKVPGEEVEILNNFKAKLATIRLEKLDQKIDSLEVYDETKTLLKEAKGEIVASIYGSIDAVQVMGVMEEEKATPLAKASPASAYCLRLGYNLEQRVKDGVAYNVCIHNGQECEELAFYRNECTFNNDAAE